LAEERAEEFAYVRVGEAIRALIRSGTLEPGDRVPSVRRMSRQWGVSVPTVMHAYRLLEARGEIAARPRAGFYVLPPPALSLAGGARTRAATAIDPIAISDLIMGVLETAADASMVPLGTALPDPELLPSSALARHLGRSARREAMRSVALALPSGSPELRREIARRAIAGGASVSPDDVIVTCGCSEAVLLCLRAVARPGDTVAVESPTYYGTLQALRALDLRALELPVDPETGPSLDVLAAALAQGGVAAVVVTPTVHNPLGFVMADERKRELVELLARYGVPAIEDQTYADLASTKPPARSLQAFDREGLVLACGSFSKTLAPAYRLGWTIPGRFRDKVLHYKLATTAGTPLPPQLAIAEFLASGAYEPHLRRLRGALQNSLHRTAHEAARRLPDGTRLSRPAGGFLLWVELPEEVDSIALQRRAMERGLSVAPGPAFSASGNFLNYTRLNGGFIWSERLARSLDLLAQLVET
jgi:DNA-binding transcriptional MocR family regulator